MAITLALILVCLILPFLAGIPLCYFLLKPSAISPERWLLAPFLGIALLIVVAQNLLYLDYEISRLAMPLVVLALTSWAIFFFDPQGARASLKVFPLQSVLFALLVFFTHAVGLLIAGAEMYVGQGWVDQFNYASTAQYFLDEGFKAESIDNLYLRTADHFKHDRIGQSVFHAIVAAIGGTDAKTAFMPVIYLGPFLTALSISFLAKSIGFGRFAANAVSLLAATLPAVAQIALENFLSQSLGLPFVFLFPVLACWLFQRRDMSTLFVAALLSSALLTIYTEFAPLAVFVICCCAFHSIMSATDKRHTLLVLLATLLVFSALTLALIPYFTLRLPELIGRTVMKGALSEIYPWAASSEGYARLIIGDLVRWIPSSVVEYIGYCVGILMVVGFTGLVYAAVRQPNKRQILVGTGALMITPFVALLIGKSEFSYQFYKLLLSVAPLFVLSIYITYVTLKRTIPRWAVITAGIFAVLYGSTVIAATAKYSTYPLNLNTIIETKRGGAHLIATDAFHLVAKTLKQLGQASVWILWHDTVLWGGAYLNGWLHYSARGSKIWSANTSASDFVPNPALPDRPPGGEIILVSPRLSSNNFRDTLILTAPPFYVYRIPGLEYENALNLLKELTAPEKYTFSVQIVEPSTYPAPFLPLLISGGIGNADLLTLGFRQRGRLYFRYERWGVPPTIGGEFPYKPGTIMTIDVVLDRFKRKLQVSMADQEVLSVPLLLDAFVPSRGLSFGQNAGIDVLEGQYPVAKQLGTFTIVEHHW